MEIGPAAAAVAQLATATSSVQQVAAVSVNANPGGGPGTLEQTGPAKLTKPQRPDPGQAPVQDQTAAPEVPTANTANADQVERMEPLSERQLFDYMVDVEKSLNRASGYTGPGSLVDSALHSLEGALQQAQQAFTTARSQLAGAGTQPDPSRLVAQDVGAAPQMTVTPEGGGPTPAVDMAATLERSISFMWAAANVGLVVNSVTAATASANTLIKQQ